MSHIVDSATIEQLLRTNALTEDLTSTATSAGTLTLTSTSTVQQRFTGSTAGQLVKLPDATTLVVGHIFMIWNDSTQSITIQNNTPTTLFTLAAGFRALVTAVDISSAAGSWTYWTTGQTSLKVKAGSVAAGSFSGNPKTATVTFTTAFVDTNYSISIMGQDGRSWKYQTKAAGSFVINSQANTALTGAVDWIAEYQGES